MNSGQSDRVDYVSGNESFNHSVVNSPLKRKQQLTPRSKRKKSKAVIEEVTTDEDEDGCFI